MADVPEVRARQSPSAQSQNQSDVADGLLQDLRERVNREYRRVPVPECLCHMIRWMRFVLAQAFLFFCDSLRCMIRCVRFVPVQAFCFCPEVIARWP